MEDYENEKKISIVLLVLCMLFGLAACGTEEPAAPDVLYSTTCSVKDGWITFADADPASVKLEIIEDSLKMEVSPIGAGLVFTRK